MPSTGRIRFETHEHLAVLWIENPPLNLLTLSMVADLATSVGELEKDDAVRAVVVTGAALTHFCGGVDLAEWARLSAKEAQDAITRGQDAFWALEHLTKPTIAAVSGLARGAGAELALACDVRIADESAVLGHPDVDLGAMPHHGGTARLSKIVGRSKAFEILATGKDVKALDALRLGIVDHLSAPGHALEQARDLAKVLGKKPRAAVRAIKRALVEGDEKPYRNRFLLESQHAVQLLWTDDYKAAIAKHREKRS